MPASTTPNFGFGGVPRNRVMAPRITRVVATAHGSSIRARGTKLIPCHGIVKSTVRMAAIRASEALRVETSLASHLSRPSWRTAGSRRLVRSPASIVVLVPLLGLCQLLQVPAVTVPAVTVPGSPNQVNRCRHPHRPSPAAGTLPGLIRDLLARLPATRRRSHVSRRQRTHSHSPQSLPLPVVAVGVATVTTDAPGRSGLTVSSQSCLSPAASPGARATITYPYQIVLTDWPARRLGPRGRMRPPSSRGRRAGQVRTVTVLEG